MNKNVLIVDNEEVVHTAMRISLKKFENLNIYFVKRSKEALIVLRDRNIDLLISDYNLDGENGLDLLKSVKMEFPFVKVIIMSGFLESETRNQCLRLGAVAVIEKSNLSHELIPEIERVLRGNDG